MKQIIYLAALAPLILFGCTKKDAKQTTQDNSPVKVKVEMAQTQEIDQIYDYTSTVDAAVKNYITSAGGTRIEKIWVQVGTHVRKGQRLVTMESTSLATTMDQLANLKSELNRMSALYKSGGVSKQQLDQVQTQYDVARKSADNLRRNIVLSSPINGVVTQKNFDNGDVSGSQPILQVMQISPVKLKFSINESLYSKVKLGMAVKATVEVFGDEEFFGKITLIAPTIDPASRTFAVEASFANGNQKLKPGMFGRATLNLGKAMKILVSDKAIVKQEGTNNKYVYIENGGKVEFRQVVLGRRLDNRYEILSGINEGENVVTEGQSRLKNGVSVNVVK